MSRYSQRAFALPTVLIASIVMMIVLLASLSATTSIHASLNQQYYERMARNAAEAGLVYANACLSESNFSPEWTNGQPLRPNTDCSGGSDCVDSPSCFVISGVNNVRSTFEVGAVSSDSISGVYEFKVTGKSYTYSSTSNTPISVYSVDQFVKVGGKLSSKQVVAGYSVADSGSFFATLNSQGVNTVGFNGYGQLGDGTTITRLTPATYVLPEAVYAEEVFINNTGGGGQIFVLTTNGKVYASGYNQYGQLGVGSWSYRISTPRRVSLPNSERVVEVIPTFYNTYFYTESKKIYASGICDDGRLGTDYSISGCTSHANTPQLINFPSGAIPTSNIVTDNKSVFVLTSNGRIYSWGSNTWGQLGDGTTTHRSSPVPSGSFGTGSSSRATAVVTDGDTTYVLDDAGDVWSIGSNYFGQRGTDSSSDPYVHTSYGKITGPMDTKRIVKVVTDQYHFLAMADDGSVYAAGLNGRGQLADGTTTNRSIPVLMQGMPSGVRAKDIVAVSNGSAFSQNYNDSFVVGDDGKVYGAGSNQYDQLGLGPSAPSYRTTLTPMLILGQGGKNQAKEVQSARGTTMVLTDQGYVFTVGNNSHGQLGDGTTQSSHTPEARKYINPAGPQIY